MDINSLRKQSRPSEPRRNREQVTVERRGPPPAPPDPLAKSTAQRKPKSHGNSARPGSNGSRACLRVRASSGRHFLSPALMFALECGPQRQLWNMLVGTRFIDKGRSPGSSKAPHKSSCRRRLRTTPQVLSFLHFGVKRDRVGLYMGIVRDNRKSVKMNKKERFPVSVGRERYMKDP